MSNMRDFKKGDRVAHIMCGDGKVIEADETLVRVRYQRTLMQKPLIGSYDRQWFALNPEYLFHRSAKAAKP